MQHGSLYQNIFLFKIWAVWEERQSFKSFSSAQIWELHPVKEAPIHRKTVFQKKDFWEEDERFFVATELFEEIWDSCLAAKLLRKGDNILLYDFLSNDQESIDIISIIKDFLDTFSFEQIGIKARNYIEANTKEE